MEAREESGGENVEGAKMTPDQVTELINMVDFGVAGIWLLFWLKVVELVLREKMLRGLR